LSLSFSLENREKDRENRRRREETKGEISNFIHSFIKFSTKDTFAYM